MIDASEVRSPGWWFKRLGTELLARKHRYDTLERYYTGEQAVPINANKDVRDAYQRLMKLCRTNYAELCVEAVRERMQPVGFRTGADGDELGDKEAWRVWQANSLDADINLVLRSQLAMGDGYMIVGDVDDEIGAPLITPEDPRQVITEHDPCHRRKVRAALKLYTDEAEGRHCAYVYLPGVVWKATRPKKSGTSDNLLANLTAWDWDGDPQPLPFDTVPVVRFANRPDNHGRSAGEYEPHLPVLDRINYGILNRLEIVTLQAFRQRALKGGPKYDAAGNEIDYSDIFNADPGAMWNLPDGAELWESGVLDLGPIHTAGRDDVMDFAAVTRTPLFYLTPDAANGSAEGAALMREGLVFKTTDRIVQASESAEQVMSLAFMFAKDEKRAKRGDMECLWAPPERYSLAERADAATKAMAGGVTWRSAMRSIWQFSPQEIDRMETERVTDAFLQPTPAPSTQQPTTQPVVPVTDAPVA